ncbi:MAG: hypothetical protein MJY84_07050 [Bacteroidales bacterium]|nr:hypothetical protein [Bacteroidales bacterium]
MPIIFTCDEELIFAMNATALAAFIFKESLRILTFEIMNNHFHFVICGTRQNIEDFFHRITKKLKRTIPTAGRMQLYIKPVQDLSAMRNNIIYTNRNGYVANPDCTPFSYPWGAGRYYFNDIPAVSTFNDIGYAQNRAMFRGDNVKLPADWQLVDASSMKDGSKRDSPVIASEKTPCNTRYIAPPSFCDIRLGMAMFRDAHHYFAMVSKNVEAYAGIAVDIDDGEFLTDQELFSQIQKVVREKYRLVSVRELSNAQKLDIARTLHYDYRSSNGQIRRILGLSQYDVNQLFKG